MQHSNYKGANQLLPPHIILASSLLSKSHCHRILLCQFPIRSSGIRFRCSVSSPFSPNDSVSPVLVFPTWQRWTFGIPGDGRCLFRSVVYGACLREGKPSPSESLQKELADELRAKVVDEFIKRRADTEWFVEGNFDTYVMQMKLPHIWGGEPELLMSSHVLQTPITVYMHDKKPGRFKVIAEYGQEYGKENPIRVLYHGYGHYDALDIPLNTPKPKLYTQR